MATGKDVEIEYGEKLDDEDVVALYWEARKDSEDWRDPWKKDAEELNRMYASGDGLSELDRSNLVETEREPISFPYATGTINAILGADQADRKEVVFRGGDTSVKDQALGEWITTVVRHFMNRHNGHREESAAQKDQLITGEGSCEAYLDTSTQPIGIPLKRVPYWEHFPDPDAIEGNRTDASYDIRERLWKKEEIEARWPGTDLAKLASPVAGVGSFGLQPTGSVENRWRSGQGLARKNRYRVVDFQFCRYVPRVVWFDPETGERRDTPPEVLEERRKEMEDDFAARVAEYETQVQEQAALADPLAPAPMVLPPEPPAPIEEHRYAGKTYFRAFIAVDSAKNGGAGVVLSHEEMSLPRFTRNQVTGFEEQAGDKQRVRFFGPMRTLFHAQKYLNKALRVYLEIMERGAKGGGFVEESAVIGDQQEFIRNRSVPGRWEIVADGANASGAIQFAPNQQVPSGWESFMQRCIDSISALTGVTDWWKGTATSERSNVLITNLQERNAIMLNPVTEPMTALRKQNGLLIAGIALRHLPVSQLDSIIGEVEIEGVTHEPAIDPMTGQPQVDPEGGKVLQPMMVEYEGEMVPATPGVLLKLADPLAFDVVVDTGQATPTQRQAIAQMFVQTNLLQTLSDAGAPMEVIIPWFVRYFPAPAEMVKVLGDELERRMNESKALQTQEGILAALAGLPPDQVQETLAQAAQLYLQAAPPEAGQEPGVM